MRGTLKPSTCLNSQCAQAHNSALQGRNGDCISRAILYRGIGGVWLSLVEHLVRDEGVVGSNPITPTILFPLLSKDFCKRADAHYFYRH